MEYTRLGSSGLKISKVILGTMSFGSPKWMGWILPEENALPILKHAYDSGINTFDTADVYSHGVSEQILGNFLRKYDIQRSKVVIMSKVCCEVVEDETQPPLNLTNDGEAVNQCGLSRKHILDAAEASVKRLGTYIDVFQIHRLDRDVPMKEIMGTLNEVIEKGWVRYIGASSMAAWEFQMLQNVAKEHGWHQFISMQNYHNLLYREEEREMLPYCKATGVGIIPWSPLARGALARPWSKTHDSARDSSDVWMEAIVRAGQGNPDKTVVDRVEELAEKKGVKMAQVAVAWSLKKEVNPILGLMSAERIDEAVGALKVELTEREMKYLEEPYIPKLIQAVAY
ncbi:MAG: hypothetical protein M1834_005888 [Cirrosporium novae-zelandiae]|nr:MAG: hypothetical protein M1834_005888 [Cirrosporium novae-zelandiae]